MLDSPDPLPPELPVFLPEWSVWDTVITQHYEDASKSAKDFLYELVRMNVDRPVKLSVIPEELKTALDGAFGSRTIFNFLMEHGATPESIPSILVSFLPRPLDHRAAVFLLGFWKSLNFQEVYIVTEDKSLNEVLEQLNNRGMNLSHLNIVNCEEALKILKSKCR